MAKRGKISINKLKKSWIGLLLIVAIGCYQFYQDNKPIEAGKRFEVTLNECVDGDTAWFNIDGKKTKVRFLYIDTPESTQQIEPYGKEASEFVVNKLTHASKIELELNKDGNQYDKYNRMLVWVFVDDQLLQEEIAAKGYVEKFYDYGDAYTYKQEIIDANKEAKSNKLGIYSNK